jgi:hypothetical protein
MVVKIYIFIFFIVIFVSIESGKTFCARNFNSTNPKIPGLEQPTAGEIVINEIMADPTPVAGLPDREYLELYNARTTAVNLKGWSLGLGAKLKIFPDVTVSPGGYLLVSAPGGAKDLQQYGRVIEISGFLVNNDGLTISLYDPDKQLADQVEYLPSLHKKGFEEGGFSLERIDPYRLCGQRFNWVTTLSAKGGTPGSENSVRAANPDNMPPQILFTYFSDSTRLDIRLSESFSLPGAPADYLKDIPAGVLIDSVKTDQYAGMIQVYFRPSTIRNGVKYSLSLHGIKDECINTMPDQAVKFGYYVPVKSDLLISEVLFNPYPEGSDFVEIYNNSGHEVDLSELFLATRDDTKELKQISQISSTQQYLPVGAYLATTKSREGILRFYPTKCEDCILQTEKFPTLADLSGCVVLLNKNLDVIDEMEYNDGMHHPLITQTEGISLERISFAEPASRKENWHSAAKSAGFATPGYQNSVEARVDSLGKMVSIDPEIFSPNNDGISDQLNIYINTSEPGWILNITILNCAGRVVRNLANNFMTGSTDQLLWDGLGDDFQKVQPGIYILSISLFERTGKNQMKRFACVLTDHL